MNMKGHILAALREEFDSWEKLPAGLKEEQITAPHFDLNWSIKDVIAHLWAWMQGGLFDREPDYPRWIVNIGEDWEESADRVNALTFETRHRKPWSEIYQLWKNGFLQFLELGNKIAERDLLDGDRYAWLKGYSLAFILVASYDHHQEHLEKLLALLREN